MVDIDNRKMVGVGVVVAALLVGFFVLGGEGGEGSGSAQITVNTELDPIVDVLDVEVRNNENVQRLVLRGEPIKIQTVTR